MTIRRFEDLEAWKLGRELAKAVYEVSGKGAFARDFELCRQMRAAAGSIMHNCAEGFDSGSNPEFVRFLRMAQRSCTEVQSQLYIAFDQAYLNQAGFETLYRSADQISRCIGGLIKYLRSTPKPKPSH